jgi:hypothetical protein
MFVTTVEALTHSAVLGNPESRRKGREIRGRGDALVLPYLTAA